MPGLAQRPLGLGRTRALNFHSWADPSSKQPIPESLLNEQQIRRFSDARLHAPYRKGGDELFCLMCKKKLMLCHCQGLDSADKIPFIHDLKPQPVGMTHADHYFRLASIFERMYIGNFPFVDVSRFMADWGGLMTAALKLNMEALLQAAEAYAADLNLASIKKEANLDLGKPLKLLSILDVDCQDKAAVGRFIQAAVAKFVVGNLSQMCRYELWFSMKVVEAAPISDVHKELLVDVLSNINGIVWVPMSLLPVIAPDYSKQPQIVGYANHAAQSSCSTM
ncbi:hypothetical protein WJX74_004529 [Apatococcus lobatus]|uniref:Uncharacterized protein n=1 Tax=Apatococcus lobatus TaxID=904363 RepID=A0AAW1QLI3_9CHLO